MSDAGNELFCITSKWTDGSFARSLLKIGVGYKPLKLGWYYISNLRWSLDSLLHYPASFIQFYWFNKRTWFDFVYTTSFRYIILLYPFFKKNIIYHVHDPNGHSRQSRFFLKLIDKKIVKYIAVSAFIKKDLIACGINKNKVEVIYNGIDILEQSKQKKSLQSHTLTLGIVGQVISRKGHEDVINALKILKEKGLDVFLLIVGKGNEKFIAELKLLIVNFDLTAFVQWRNFKDNIQEIYEGIDVVVAPTRNDEPFGLIAIEGNMLGLPVIVSKRGGLIEVIIDGLNGFLIEPNNPLQLADKVSALYNNRGLLKEFGENGRARVIERFTKERMVSSINILIEQTPV